MAIISNMLRKKKVFSPGTLFTEPMSMFKSLKNHNLVLGSFFHQYKFHQHFVVRTVYVSMAKIRTIYISVWEK
jgi:hypothetical protein